MRQLHRTVSAVQYDPNDANEDMNDLAWNQLRLSDASYLPLERTRLLQFLTKWGSFPHIQVRVAVRAWLRLRLRGSVAGLRGGSGRVGVGGISGRHGEQAIVASTLG